MSGLRPLEQSELPELGSLIAINNDDLLARKRLLERLRDVPLDDPLLDGLLAQLFRSWAEFGQIRSSPSMRSFYALFGLAKDKDEWIARSGPSELHVLKSPGGKFRSARALCGRKVPSGHDRPRSSYGAWNSYTASQCQRCLALARSGAVEPAALAEMAESQWDPVRPDLADTVEVAALLQTVELIKVQMCFAQERQALEQQVKAAAGDASSLTAVDALTGKQLSRYRRDEDRDLRLLMNISDLTDLSLEKLAFVAWRNAYCEILLQELQGIGDRTIDFLLDAPELGANYLTLLSPEQPRVVDILTVEMLEQSCDLSLPRKDVLRRKLIDAFRKLRGVREQELKASYEAARKASIEGRAAAAAETAISEMNEQGRLVADLQAIHDRHHPTAEL